MSKPTTKPERKTVTVNGVKREVIVPPRRSNQERVEMARELVRTNLATFEHLAKR